MKKLTANIFLLILVCLGLKKSTQCQTIYSFPIAHNFVSAVDSAIQPNQNLELNVTENYTRITSRLAYNKAIAKLKVPTAYHENPDFGFMPEGSNLKNVYEEINKRTANTRVFRDQNDESVVYYQQSSMPINYFKNGYWLSIDSRLKQEDAKHFVANQQPLECALDITKQKTTMYDGENFFGFNNFKMIEYDTSGNQTIHSANWSNYSVGDNGIIIYNVFNDIDLVLKFSPQAIKSNFVIKHSRPFSSRLVFVDSLELPDAYHIGYHHGTMQPQGFSGDLSINDSKNNSQYIYGNIDVTDNTNNKMPLKAYYTLVKNNICINVYADVFNNSGITYPLSIDPLVTYGPFNSAANPIGAGTSPAFCSNAIVASIPGGTTPTDLSASWSITNTNNACGCPGAQNCNRNKIQVYITSSCGGATPAGAPGIIWACVPAACNSLGTWAPTLPFGASGTTSMATCIAPSCAAQNITFTLFLNQFGCNGGAACGSCVYATNTCSHLNNWSVTIQAHSLESLGNSATGNGSASIIGSCNVNTAMNPVALYGVPSYTYLWNPGGATSATVIDNQGANGVYTYTCTVTDACGVSRTASFTITINDCPLPVELVSFTAQCENNNTRLTWTTQTEINNNYFIVEKSINGIDFFELNKINGAGNSNVQKNYFYLDDNPYFGLVYYRLQQVDFNGHSELFPVTTSDCGAASGVSSFVYYDESGSISITINSAKADSYKIFVFDDLGKKIIEKEIDTEKGINNYKIPVSHFRAGAYFVEVLTGTTKTSTSFLIK